MAIIGTFIDDIPNPDFTMEDFLFWLPQFSKYLATQKGQSAFEKIYPIVNDKIFKGVYGPDWEYAMALGIAHYLYLKGQSEKTPSGSKLSEIPGGNPTSSGIMSSAGIGAFNKTIDLDHTLVSGDGAKFWNQSDYGKKLMNLMASKGILTMMVATTWPIPGTGC